MNDLIKVSRTRTLESLDVFALALNNRSRVLSRRFQSLTYVRQPLSDGYELIARA